MRKMIFILCIPTALLSACSPSGMQGNPAAVQAGAAIGGVLGAIVVTGPADTTVRNSAPCWEL